MRKRLIRVLAAAAVCGFGFSAHAQCVPVLSATGHAETVCGDFRPLRISPVVLGDPALIRSAAYGDLVPVPADGGARLVGQMIPLDVLIGRRVVGLGRAPEPVLYNNPSSLPGSVDPYVALMPLPSVRRVVVREAPLRSRSVRMIERVRLEPMRAISVKD